MPATLRVTHEINFGIELRRGRLDIVLDGQTVGSVDNHETCEIPVPVGPHAVHMRKGRYSSREISFSAAEDECVSLRCHGVRIWPMLVASLFVPKIGLALTRE